MKLWIYSHVSSDVKCYILWHLTWNKTKVINNLLRVRRMDWKSSLKEWWSILTPMIEEKSISIRCGNQTFMHHFLFYPPLHWRSIPRHISLLLTLSSPTVRFLLHLVCTVTLQLDYHKSPTEMKCRIWEWRLAGMCAVVVSVLQTDYTAAHVNNGSSRCLGFDPYVSKISWKRGYLHVFILSYLSGMDFHRSSFDSLQKWYTKGRDWDSQQQTVPLLMRRRLFNP